MAQRGELQIVVRDGDRHAVLMQAIVRGGDIYSGPKLVWGDKLFRRSPHVKAKQKPYAGKMQLSAAGSDLEMLEWGYKARPGRGKRVTKVVELPHVAQYPGFTSELWAFDPDRPDLIDQHLGEHYEPGGRVVAHVVADWTTPNLLGLLWTLKTPAWEGIT
jgi:hypothetical protein